MRIRFRSSPDLPSGVWARTIYVPAMDYYFVNVNVSLVRDPNTGRNRYPYSKSSDRGLNFTLAHEFGHIFLGHAKMPDELKIPHCGLKKTPKRTNLPEHCLCPSAV